MVYIYQGVADLLMLGIIANFQWERAKTTSMKYGITNCLQCNFRGEKTRYSSIIYMHRLTVVSNQTGKTCGNRWEASCKSTPSDNNGSFSWNTWIYISRTARLWKINCGPDKHWWSARSGDITPRSSTLTRIHRPAEVINCLWLGQFSITRERRPRANCLRK